MTETVTRYRNGQGEIGSESVRYDMAMDPAAVASRIEEACDRQSISVAELCRRAKLPANNYISRMKSGEVSGRKHIPAIAAALGMSVEQLTTMYDAPRQKSPELATALGHLAEARAANALLAEQLGAALAEVARLKTARQPMPDGIHTVPERPQPYPPGTARKDRKNYSAAWEIKTVASAISDSSPKPESIAETDAEAIKP